MTDAQVDEPRRRTSRPPRPEPRGLRAMFLLRRAPRTWHLALRTMLSVVVPASVGYATGHFSLGLLAAVGGFASLFGGGRPYGYRTKLLVLVSLGEAVAVALGIEAEQVPWAGVLTVTFIAVVATWICNALAVVPGAYQFALCCATGTALHEQGADPVQSGLLVLAGGLFATLLQLTGALVDRHGPERQAVAHAADAVADFVDAQGGPDSDELQHQASLAMQQAWTVLVAEQPVASRSGRRRPPEGLLRLREIGRTLQLVLADAMRRGTPDPGAAGRARQLGWQARRKNGPRHRGVLFVLPLGRPHPWRVLLTALEPGSRSSLVLVRVGLASLVSGLLASALGLSHAYWAVATSVLVLATGFDQRRTVQRGLERSIGTVLGVGAVALILRGEPTGPLLIAVVAVVIYGAQLLVPRNYAAAAVLITCSALLMGVGGGSSSDAGSLLLARALDTLIGAGVAFSVFALVSRKTAAAWLPDAL
ncbi:MAG: FUSC family protein, partial [Janthinobacterium lividum]